MPLYPPGGGEQDSHAVWSPGQWQDIPRQEPGRLHQGVLAPVTSLFHRAGCKHHSWLGSVHIGDLTFLPLLQHKYDTERVQIIHASLHPGFKRDDLFRLLHLNSESLTDRQTYRQMHRVTSPPSSLLPQVSWFTWRTRKEVQ